MIQEFKASDLYETPLEVFDYWDKLFSFNLDVCAEKKTAKCEMFFTAKEDALTQPWHFMTDEEITRAWMNPPYSKPAPWIEKAKAEQAKGALVVALLPADTSTKWFQSIYHDPTITTLLPPGRIRFLYNGVRQGSPKFGNAVAIFWPHP